MTRPHYITTDPDTITWKDVSRIVNELCKKHGYKNYIGVKKVEDLRMNLPFKDAAIITLVHNHYIASFKR